jgi:lysophospholipase L1-like esterase
MSARAAVLAAVLCMLACPAAASASTPWLTAWTAAQSDPGPASSVVDSYDGTGGRTVRDVVRPTAAGGVLRVRLTNRFGTRALTFDDVRVGLAAGEAGAAVTPRSSVRVTFRGRRRVTIGVGKSVVSDAVRRPVRFDQRLVVSMYSAGATGRTTTSGGLLHTNYLSESGDHTAATSAAPFTTTTNHWYFLAGVDVVPTLPSAGAVVAVGASATTGTGSTPDAGRAWPELLAKRLRARYPGMAMPVLNSGIPGNTLHESSPCFGQSGLKRLRRDAFDQRGVRSIVFALGSNDITQPRQPHEGLFGPCDARRVISADRLIALYRQVIRRAHVRGLKIYGTTINGFKDFRFFTPVMEAERLKVNRWIRTSRAFDAVIDFNRATADPNDAARIDPRLGAGDGLHPNDAGHAAMARAIPLSLFRP